MIFRTIIPTDGHPLSDLEQEEQDQFDREYAEEQERERAIHSDGSRAYTSSHDDWRAE